MLVEIERSSGRRNRWDWKLQAAVFLGLCLLATLSLVQLQSTILLMAPIAVFGAWWVLQTPFRSICAYIVITDILTIRPKAEAVDGAPTALDFAMGILLVLLAVYWIVRIKIWDRAEFSISRSHLLMALFFVWAIPVTIGGSLVLSSSLNAAIREILNLSPLLVLPVLYGKYIRPDSREETIILWLVLISGALVVTWNIHAFRSNVAKAYYLYQTGRAAYDLALTCLIIFSMASLLMLRHRWWQSLLAMGMLLYAFLGLAISMTRTLYVGAGFGILLVILLGVGKERARGLFAQFKALGLLVAILTPVFFASHLFRLLVLNFGSRFLTTQHAAHDPSLLNRFSEWQQEWYRILDSPVFGNGFGAMYRFFNIIRQHHEWSGFSHNSYLYILFKTGFFGGLLFIGACVGLVIKSFALARNMQLSDRSRMILRACVASILIQLLGALTGPTFDQKDALLWLGLTWGVVASMELSIDRIANQRNQFSSLSS